MSIYPVTPVSLPAWPAPPTTVYGLGPYQQQPSGCGCQGDCGCSSTDLYADRQGLGLLPEITPTAAAVVVAIVGGYIVYRMFFADKKKALRAATRRARLESLAEIAQAKARYA